ncbi:chondroitinase-B domain-containing protein [Paenibacillus sp. VCA1]|uniref:chondroitinase-B domain-containing protein n=1 Tax=Paenibacillus sp. VCA1 TaxID=3039148 RepID=UPI0028719BCB|nr:chondroitinase-B domain-containing protein [Paenibacillus sp. VCA1]MDR9855477.1 chondroitinase-B domain-containing protein [Paenibacillus sp. VCA1]
MDTFLTNMWKCRNVVGIYLSLAFLLILGSLTLQPSHVMGAANETGGDKMKLEVSDITASSFQPNTNFVPGNVLDGIWGEDEVSQQSRWSASGQGEWLQFDLGKAQEVTYVKIAFLNARERLSNFEMKASDSPDFSSGTTVFQKQFSRQLQAEDSILQTYMLEHPVKARYLRLIGYGNNASGSSGQWNSIMEVELYTGTPPETGEPNLPPADAGNVNEGDVEPPVLKHIKVKTAKELQQALDQAVSGTWIELQNGNYEQNGPFVILKKYGSPAYPIRITAANAGKAVITGNSYLHIEDSSYVEVSGLKFQNGIGDEAGNQSLIERGLANRTLTGVHPGVQLQSASHISILGNTFALDETNQPYRFMVDNRSVWCLINVKGSCRYGENSHDPNGEVYNGPTPYEDNKLLTDNGTNRHYIRVEGKSSFNRIAYNDIGPKKGFGAVVIYDGEGHSGQNISQYDVIEYNHFHDIGPRVSNGLEAIRLGLSSLSLYSGHVTIQHNLFNGLNGEDEIISVKSSDNIIRYNTIRNSYGGIVARHGNRNSFYGNFILGDGKTPGLSGFRIYGNDHKIFNNYMEGLTDKIIRLDGGTHDGGPEGGTNPTVRWGGDKEQSAELNSLPEEERTELLRGHWRQYNVQIFHNTIVNVGGNTPAITLGGRTYQPVGTKIYNNLIFSNAGTIFNETGAMIKAPAAERPEYKGNMVEGIALASNNPVVGETVKKEDLRLVRGIDGLIRLSVYSPAIDAAVSPLFALDDMDGQMRYAPDVGADEYNADGPKENRPLTTKDVGPGALKK